MKYIEEKTKTDYLNISVDERKLRYLGLLQSFFVAARRDLYYPPLDIVFSLDNIKLLSQTLHNVPIGILDKNLDSDRNDESLFWDSMEGELSGKNICLKEFIYMNFYRWQLKH